MTAPGYSIALVGDDRDDPGFASLRELADFIVAERDRRAPGTWFRLVRSTIAGHKSGLDGACIAVRLVAGDGERGRLVGYAFLSGYIYVTRDAMEGLMGALATASARAAPAQWEAA